MLCCVVLCCAVLCCAVLCCAVLCLPQAIAGLQDHALVLQHILQHLGSLPPHLALSESTDQVQLPSTLQDAAWRLLSLAGTAVPSNAPCRQRQRRLQPTLEELRRHRSRAGAGASLPQAGVNGDASQISLADSSASYLGLAQQPLPRKQQHQSWGARHLASCATAGCRVCAHERKVQAAIAQELEHYSNIG